MLEIRPIWLVGLVLFVFGVVLLLRSTGQEQPGHPGDGRAAAVFGGAFVAAGLVLFFGPQ